NKIATFFNLAIFYAAQLLTKRSTHNFKEWHTSVMLLRCSSFSSLGTIIFSQRISHGLSLRITDGSTTCANPMQSQTSFTFESQPTVTTCLPREQALIPACILVAITKSIS